MTLSVRGRLTIWYFFVFSVILLFFGSVFYRKACSDLDRSVDQRLTDQANGVSNTIFAFWRAEWETRHRSTLRGRERMIALIPKTMEREIQKGRFKDLINRWANETRILETAVQPFRVIQNNGSVIIANAGFSKLEPPIHKDIPREAKTAATVYTDFYFKTSHYRMITLPVIENGRLIYTLQTVVSLEQEDKSLAELKRWIFFFIPAALAASLIGGLAIASVALRPVGKMISQARHIGAYRLSERLEVPKTRDELQRLGETFNDMLSRLERAFKRMRQFSAAASHELRTPLTIMKGELEVALRKPRSVEEYQKVMGAVLGALNEITSVVEQLLALAHTETQEDSVDWEPLDLSGVASEVRAEWLDMAAQKNVRLDLVAGKPYWVRGEKRLLKRLIANLLENALKHTPKGGTITLEIALKGGGPCLSVRDTGSGIPADQIPGLFDRFFSRGAAASADGNSTGLGLGLCRWITEAHRGRIEVANAPGGGALFSILLPAIPGVTPVTPGAPK